MLRLNRIKKADKYELRGMFCGKCKTAVQIDTALMPNGGHVCPVCRYRLTGSLNARRFLIISFVLILVGSAVYLMLSLSGLISNDNLSQDLRNLRVDIGMDNDGEVFLIEASLIPTGKDNYGEPVPCEGIAAASLTVMDGELSLPHPAVYALAAAVMWAASIDCADYISNRGFLFNAASKSFVVYEAEWFTLMLLYLRADDARAAGFTVGYYEGYVILAAKHESEMIVMADGAGSYVTMFYDDFARMLENYPAIMVD